MSHGALKYNNPTVLSYRRRKISDTEQELFELARCAGDRLAQRNLLLVTAESCTGGWLGQAVTAVSGSSAWYDRGFITYSNVSKCELLGVRQETLDQWGAVSPQVAREMVVGALGRSCAGIGVSITGIAGPDGGTATKPVGMVCFAWMARDGPIRQETSFFSGDRDAIRHAAVTVALQGILRLLDDKSDSL